jgi:hypothetical protein
MTKLTKDEVTPEVIEGWKKQFTGVFAFTAKDDSGYKAFFRSPTRKEIEACSATKSGVESNTVLAKACFLAGDEQILNEDKYFFGLSEQLKVIIKKVEGELEEL